MSGERKRNGRAFLLTLTEIPMEMLPRWRSLLAGKLPAKRARYPANSIFLERMQTERTLISTARAVLMKSGKAMRCPDRPRKIAWIAFGIALAPLWTLSARSEGEPSGMPVSDRGLSGETTFDTLSESDASARKSALFSTPIAPENGSFDEPKFGSSLAREGAIAPEEDPLGKPASGSSFDRASDLTQAPTPAFTDLSDVSPDDWAAEALRSLIERLPLPGRLSRSHVSGRSFPDSL